MEAIQRGKLDKLKGWGAATLKRIEENTRQYLSTRHLLLYYEAARLWEKLVETLGENAPFVHPVGEFSAGLHPPAKGRSLSAPYALGTGLCGFAPDAVTTPDKAELHGGKVVLFPVEEETLGWALIAHTGPESFTEAMRRRLGEPRALSGLSEEALFERVGLPYILPAWRDWEDIIPLAEQGKLPEPLDLSRMQGSVHVHTTYSDGADTLEAMAEAARHMGWRYLGIRRP